MVQFTLFEKHRLYVFSNNPANVKKLFIAEFSVAQTKSETETPKRGHCMSRTLQKLDPVNANIFKAGTQQNRDRTSLFKWNELTFTFNVILTFSIFSNFSIFNTIFL